MLPWFVPSKEESEKLVGDEISVEDESNFIESQNKS